MLSAEHHLVGRRLRTSEEAQVTAEMLKAKEFRLELGVGGQLNVKLPEEAEWRKTR